LIIWGINYSCGFPAIYNPIINTKKTDLIERISRLNTDYPIRSVVIDWFSKAILSCSTSNAMDEAFVIGTLNEASLHYGKPGIFNTDQGSVYTGDAHTSLLNNNGITISMDGY